MATTTPNNIPSPDSGSNYDPTVHMTALADGVQEALTERANYGTGTTAQMNAAVGRFPNGAKWFNTSDNKEYQRVGGAWVDLSVPDTGWVTVTVASGWTVNDPVQVRKIEKAVYWKGRVTPTSSKSGTQVLVAGGNVPNWATPPSILDTIRPLASNHSSSTAESAFKNGAVGADSSVTVWYGASNTDPVILSGLSGYLVD